MDAEAFLSQVESPISDAVHLRASMAAMHCFPPTQGQKLHITSLNLFHH